MVPSTKPSRTETLLTVLIPGLVFLAALAFAYMAWRPVKGVAKIATIPGDSQGSRVKLPPPTVSASRTLPAPSQPARPKPGAEPTEPTPENPTTTLPKPDGPSQDEGPDGQSQTPDGNLPQDQGQNSGTSTEN